MEKDAEDRGHPSPSKLSHFVLRTKPERFEALCAWYQDLLAARIVFKNAFSCFMTYDDEDHRVAILAMPGLADHRDETVGVDHVAFTYANLGDLITTYERLAAKGIQPIMPIHHGPTLSMYYLDPDRNQIELLIDVFATPDQVRAYLTGGQFEKNPIGVMYDPADLARRYHDGEDPAELIKPLDGAPPGPGDWPSH